MPNPAVKPVPDVVSIGEIKAIGERYMDSEIRALFYFLYLTGGRISEVMDIRIRDLELIKDAEGREIFKVHLLTRKNRRQKYRDIPVVLGNVETDMVDYIFKWIETFENADPERKLFPDLNVDSGYQHIAKQKIKINATLGLNHFPDYVLRIHPHYLRHCRLTHLVQLYGFSDTALTRFAGWSNSAPAQIYVNLNWSDLVRLMRSK